MTWRRRLREHLLTPSSYPALAAYAVTAVCLLACAICELWFIQTDSPIGFDEGYIGAMALRLLDHGMLPGVDGVGQRGPVFYWMAAIVQAVFGRYHWFGFRYVTWLAASAVVLSLLGLGLLYRRPLAGAIGAAFYVWICFYFYLPGTGFAMNGEQVVAPLLSTAALLTAVAMRAAAARTRVGCVAFAGFLTGLAGWTKITLLSAIAPLAVWVLAVPLARNQPLRDVGRVFAVLIAGWIVPVAAVPLVYVAAGHFDELVYRFFTYNTDVHMGVYADRSIWPEIGNWFVADPPPAFAWLLCACALLAYLGYLFGMHRAGALRQAMIATDVLAASLVFAVITFASGMLQMRFWGHHFIAAMPWAGWIGGLAIEGLLVGLRPRLHAVTSVAVAIALIVGLDRTVFANARQREIERKAGLHPRATEDPMCKEIHRYAGAQDPIFVWGFDGDLHVSCARKVATRFVYMTLVAGVVPPFWNVARADRVAKGAPQQTAKDLRESKPPLILDIPAKLGGVHITAVPELRRLLKNDYCKLHDFTGAYGRQATFYGRKDRGHCKKPKQEGAK